MSHSPAPLPSKESLAIYNALKSAVTQAIDTKKRLGQYAIVWKDGQPTRINFDTETQA